MLTKNHETLAIEVKRHVEDDAILQGAYWDGSHGCFIGCLAHSNDATKLGELYGLPLPLVRICENIFEALPAKEAKAFFAAVPDAVGRDGKDLTRVHWAFLASELRALPKVDDDTQSAINTVIKGMGLLASGGEWSRDAAADAAADAADAADAAHAARAARAAARAADAAHAARSARAAIRTADATDAADAARAATLTAAYAADAARAARAAARTADAADAADAARAAADAARAAARAAAYAADAAAYAPDAAARLRQRDTILRLISEA
jgi:hypothetical protein